MMRRLRPLERSDLRVLPCACTGCVFWETGTRLEPRCGAACDVDGIAAWHDRVTGEWDDCGRVACEGDEILGFIKYAPARYFPQARYFPGGAPAPDTVLLACMHIREDARQLGLGSVLLKSALRDLLLRGERTAQAFACESGLDMVYQPVIGMEFLFKNGFDVVRPHPVHPLLELDLRSLIRWGDNLEAAVQSLRIPLPSPQPVPVPLAK